MLGELLGATIVTPDLDASIAAYAEDLGYLAREGVSTIGDEQAFAWGRPEARGCRVATLCPGSGAQRFLRLVESPLLEEYRPLMSAGWNAVEIIVQNVDDLAASMTSGKFQVIGAPAVLDFDFTDQIRAMQVVGLGGEVLYLTEVGAEIPGFSLPKAISPVDRPFVAIVGAADFPTALAWYGENTDGGDLPQVAARIDFLSQAHGLSPTFRHTLATAALAGSTLVEIDAYPPATTEVRAQAACGLPAGIAMMSFATSDPVAHGRLIDGPAGELIELLLAA